MDNNESQLVSAAQQGDIMAFSKLVRLHELGIRACLIMRLELPDEADDLAQETFIVAYKKLSDFENDRPLGPWLRGIAFNLLKNYWRKRKPILVGTNTELELLLEDEINILYAQENESPTFDALKQCIKKLDEKSASLIEKHYHQDISVADLKRQYQVKHSAMTMRLHRIRERLKLCVRKTLAHKDVFDQSKNGGVGG